MTPLEKVLAVVLTGSVILNVYLWWYDDPTLAECFATPGYMIPETIDQARAKELIDIYKENLVDPDSTTGAIITRSAFDEMMCLKDCNAIAFMFAMDPDGAVGPGGKGTFVIFKGVKVDYDAHGNSIRSVDDIGSAYYLTHNWCPPSCMSY